MECRNCGSKKTKFLFTKDNVPYLKCLTCRIWFSGEVLSDDSLKGLYGYYATSPSVVLTKINELRYEALLNKFEGYRKTNRLLDVGCGRGDLLRIAKERDWEAVGTEFSQEAVELCKSNNLTVLAGKLSEINFPHSYFDVIFLQEVIEHVDESPEKILNEVLRILRPGGIVYLTTPNLNSLSQRLLGKKWRAFHSEHRFIFTPKNLKKMLRKSGFYVQSLKTKNIALHEIKEKIFCKVSKDNIAIRKKEQILREKIETNIFLYFLKSVINCLLNIFKCGDTILAVAEK